ncbi:MAG: endonuclease/exonuclease/phosphatase family protein [Sphingomonadaceae bacterium]
MIRVASYNMRKAIGTDRRRRPERILRILNELRADIVTLQEADRRFGERASAIPLWMLEEHSGYRPVPLGLRDDSLGWHGNAVLVGERVAIVRGEELPLPAIEPRGAVAALLEADGMRLRVVGMHLDLSGLKRRSQARALLDYLDAVEPLPTILMGDLNEWSPRGGCLRDFATRFAIADCGRSYHVGNPVARLDRIMASRHFRVADAGTHRSAAARRGSDHYPVWAELLPVTDAEAATNAPA